MGRATLRRYLPRVFMDLPAAGQCVSRGQRDLNGLERHGVIMIMCHVDRHSKELVNIWKCFNGS